AGVMLLRPSIRLPEQPDERPVVHVLADASRSMTVRDTPNGGSRRERLLAALDSASGALESLAEGAEVRFYDFGGKLSGQASGVTDLTAAADADRSAIGAVLEEIASNTSPRRADVVTLLSDGAERDPPDSNGLRSAARRLAQASVPVYPVPFGKDVGAAVGVDLQIEPLRVDPVVFTRKTVPVATTLRANGAVGRPLTVRLLIENRTGLTPEDAGPLEPVTESGRLASVVTVTPEDGSAVIPIELAFVPQRAGDIAVAVEVETIEGERLAINNRNETLVTVRTGGLRVAYIDRPRPEQKFIRRLAAAGQIEIDFLPLLGAGPLAAEKLAGVEYDAYIVGDVSPESLGPAAASSIAAAARSGAGVMFTGGLTAFGPSGWGGTPLRTFVPARPEVMPQRTTELPFRPTRLGLQRYVLRVTSETAAADTDEGRWDWGRLPKLSGVNRLRPASPLVEVWADAADGVPLLFAAEVGRSRVLAFAGDTTYLWALGGFEELHALFWRQTILWLTRKDEEEADVWATTEPRVAAAGEPIAIRFGRSGGTATDVTFRVETRDADGDWREAATGLAPRPSADGAVGRFRIDADDRTGSQPVRVTAVDAAGTVLGKAVTRYLVRDRDIELERPAADLKALSDLASLTGGRVVDPSEFSALVARFAESPPRLDPRNLVRTKTLWDGAWVLIGIICLLAAEWVVRKRQGLV
ncbi:MAG: hypothetical protein AAGJ97_09315, partial [Planctomycetota bacterium]